MYDVAPGKPLDTHFDHLSTGELERPGDSTNHMQVPVQVDFRSALPIVDPECEDAVIASPLESAIHQILQQFLFVDRGPVVESAKIALIRAVTRVDRVATIERNSQ